MNLPPYLSTFLLLQDYKEKSAHSNFFQIGINKNLGFISDALIDLFIALFLLQKNFNLIFLFFNFGDKA